MNYTHNDRRLLREINSARTATPRGVYMKSTRRYVGAGYRGGILTHGRARAGLLYRFVSRFTDNGPSAPGAADASPRETARTRRAPSGAKRGAGFFATIAAAVTSVVSASKAARARGKSEASALQRRLSALVCAAVLTCAVACAALPSYLNMGRLTVSLDIDGEVASIDTFDKTVGDLLARYAIALGEGDVLYPAASATLEDGMSIRLRRAMDVYVEADGQRRALSLLSGTVDDALRAAGVEYADGDELSYAKYSKLSPGMLISLVRVDTEHEFETQVMPFRIKYVDDDTLNKGVEKITQRGIEGKKEIQYRLTYKDGVLISREEVGERVIEAPRTRIVSVGTKVAPKATPKPKVTTASSKATTTPKPASGDSAFTFKAADGKRYDATQKLKMEVTAYTHTGRRTATGTWPGKGTIAVDKSVIPLGTKLYVSGYGFGVASDVGVRGNQVDVFLDTYEECIHWGRKRNVTVYILPK